jgi:hypothetical protein
MSRPRRLRLAALALLALLGPGLSTPARAYPLDGKARTGIRRLEGEQNAQNDAKGRKLAPGALLGSDEVTLHLTTDGSDWDLTGREPDPALRAALAGIVAERDPSYALMVIDLTDPKDIRWAGVREDQPYYPGSVGKVLCLAALFDGLRRAFPDPAKRETVLRETMVEATDWAFNDSHGVPHFDPVTGRNRNAPVARGERFTLSEWTDHMVSASANSAGSTVWKEAILLRQFGAEYPVTREREEAFFKATPKPELRALALAVWEEPLGAAGIDLAKVRQGTMWTRGGQARIPGVSSYGSPRQWARILLRIEQGRLVDSWSSREMKRYLYMTKKRYRYAYAPELGEAAVFFKSGSLYKCAPEEGFTCKKYHGNVENFMNSIAIVETPARGETQKRYIVALMSNVKRKNSAWDHARLAAAIDVAVKTRKTAAVKEAGSAAEIGDAGKGE